MAGCSSEGEMSSLNQIFPKTSKKYKEHRFRKLFMHITTNEEEHIVNSIEHPQKYRRSVVFGDVLNNYSPKEFVLVIQGSEYAIFKRFIKWSNCSSKYFKLSKTRTGKARKLRILCNTSSAMARLLPASLLTTNNEVLNHTPHKNTLLLRYPRQNGGVIFKEPIKAPTDNDIPILKKKTVSKQTVLMDTLLDEISIADSSIHERYLLVNEKFLVLNQAELPETWNIDTAAIYREEDGCESITRSLGIYTKDLTCSNIWGKFFVPSSSQKLLQLRKNN